MAEDAPASTGDRDVVVQRLAELGLELPATPKPLAAYVPAVQSGRLVYTSGQLPFENGRLKFTGIVGRDLSTDEAYQAARLCCLNALAALKAIAGSLDKVSRVVKVNGFVASDREFVDQPKVVNGASDLIAEVFGERGAHARCAVGVSSLPMNAPVELELIAELSD